MTSEELNNYIIEYIKETFPNETICYTLEEVAVQPYDTPFWWIDDISITYYEKHMTPRKSDIFSGISFVTVFKFYHKELKFKTKTEIAQIINEMRQCFYEKYLKERKK